MKVGDLVVLQSWCAERGRKALIVKLLPSKGAIIQYVDDPFKPVNAFLTNLEVISENR